MMVSQAIKGFRLGQQGFLFDFKNTLVAGVDSRRQRTKTTILVGKHLIRLELGYVNGD